MYGDGNDDDDEELPRLDPLDCMGADGIRRTFYLEGPAVDPWADGGRVHRYRVHLRHPPTPDVDHFFEASFTEVGEATFMVSLLMANGRAPFLGKGIPEAVIQYVARVSNREIVSSSNQNEGLGEFRKPSATKVWERLVAAGLAQWRPESDRYVLLRQRLPDRG